MVNEALHNDLKQILNENDSQVTARVPADSFQKIFWE